MRTETSHVPAGPARRRRPGARLLAALIALAGLAAGAGGCTTDPQVIAQANDVHQELEPTVVTDPELAAYVQKVGDRVVQTAAQLHAEQGAFDGAEPWMFQNIQFHLVASPTLNAFTTGGTHVYLYSQLFEESTTEDAFAAVVGHEFGHILGRHVQQSMDRQMGILAAAGAAGLAGAALAEDGSRTQAGLGVGAAAMAAGNLFGLGFGRDNEREADKLGFWVYVHAGWDPDKFPDFFRTMISKGYDTGGGMEAYLSSHPRLAERVQTAEQMAKSVTPQQREQWRRPPVIGQAEFDRLRNKSKQFTAAAAAAAKAGGNQQLLEAMQILDAFPACVGGPDEADEPPPAQQEARREAGLPPVQRPGQ